MNEEEEKKIGRPAGKTKEQFTLTLDEELMERVDKERESIPRSTYVNLLLERYFKNEDDKKTNTT